MVIDALTHVTPDGRWFSTAHDASETRLLRVMDEAGVDKAVVVALAGYIENAFVAAVCRRHADRLIPGASINPVAYATPREAAEAVRAVLAETPCAVLKLHPRLNGYDPLEARCLAVLEAVALSIKPVPIWLDTVFHGATCLLSKPPVETVHELAWRFRTLQFVLLHGGGTALLALAELARACPNLTLDLSLTLLAFAGTSVELDARFVLTRRDARTVIGSDFPEYTPRDYRAAFQRLAAAVALPDDKGRRILGGNLDALFTSTELAGA